MQHTRRQWIADPPKLSGPVLRRQSSSQLRFQWSHLEGTSPWGFQTTWSCSLDLSLARCTLGSGWVIVFFIFSCPGSCRVGCVQCAWCAVSALVTVILVLRFVCIPPCGSCSSLPSPARLVPPRLEARCSAKRTNKKGGSNAASDCQLHTLFFFCSPPVGSFCSAQMSFDFKI